MTNRVMKEGLLALTLAAALAAPAAAQVASIDYLGFGFETGGFLPSQSGDEMVLTCVADNVDPFFGADLGTEELTFHVYGLISAGEVPLGGNTMINYSGGTLDIYRDAGQNADWGVSPPNAVSPSTFTEGTLFFRGAFTGFTLFVAPGGYGSFEGSLDGIAGTMIDGSCSGCVYTWGGAFTQDAGAQIPSGYHLQVDGVFEIDSAVSSEAASWGSVKALFNN